MSSIDDLYDRVSKDYGRKNYLAGNDEAYVALMKKKTIFMYDAAFAQSWSEFEKPYLENSYEEMEQFLWNPPGIPWDPGGPGPGWDFPTIPSNPQDPGEPFGWPSLTVFWCQVSGCFCENDTREAMVNCSHPITGIGLAEPGARLAARDFSISADINGTSARLSITAGDDPGGAVEIDVTMQSAGGVNGSHGSLMISSCSDCEDCDTVDDVAWDDENNPTTAAAGTRTTLQVTGGVGPYTWTLLADCGGKAHLTRIETTSPVNTLIIDGGACGTAAIQVKDTCDDTCSGGVMVTTNGRWRNCDHHREIEGIQCKCACGPCHRQAQGSIGPGMRLAISCDYVGCGTPESPCNSSDSGCILGPKTCFDTYGNAFYFPCLESGCDGVWKLSAWAYWYYDFWECN